MSDGLNTGKEGRKKKDMTGKKLQVLGQFNTGTNLLMEMILNNCVNARDKSTMEVCDNMLCWKHTYHRLWRVRELLQSGDHVFIIMYKNVFAWLYGISKESYDIQIKTLDGPVTLQGFSYPNLLEIYNTYYTAYRDLVQKHPHRVVFLDYHRLIEQPDCVEYLRSRLKTIGLEVPDAQQVRDVLDRPAKIHGSSVRDWKEAQERYPKILLQYRNYVQERPGLAASYRQDLVDFFEQENKESK